MTRMGSVLGRRRRSEQANGEMPALSQSTPPAEVCKAPRRMVTPAEAMRAMTAGRRPPSAPWMRSRLRYLRYSLASSSDTMHEGSTQPTVATSAPGDAGDAHAHEGGRVDGDGAGRHLRNGDDVGKFRHVEPAVQVHHLRLNQRHGRVAAAEAEEADLEKAPKSCKSAVMPFSLLSRASRGWKGRPPPAEQQYPDDVQFQPHGRR